MKLQFARSRLAAGLVACFALAAPVASHADVPGLPATITSSGTITYCSAVSLPPMEFFNDKQQPVGVDIELGNLLASRLGVKAKFINMPFAGLIPALLAGHCDAILSQLFIKPPRLKVIDEIPYMNSQEGFILKAGAPKISGPADLSGLKAASVTGTTATNLMQAANDDLTKAGKPPINIVMFPENAPALQQVQFGQVAAYGVSYEAALYYQRLQPKVFESGSPPYFKILTGIGVSKSTPDLKLALTVALNGLMRDGTYAMVFKEWHLEEDALPPPQ
ncbi:MAG: ABC transporter substrate-binding protein [Acidocella sp. 20-57-95]|nr:MAG: ABC transporter substrate-binding protein [Acidocella sp. 20-57-95]OYV61725.1 MAG: ABC transporter substrate-binding protein [Acidocella sp. 21-58-7]HQT65188.1 ABC transporter substrate-binding protein [Acidocella sp.]HQU05251.1 ABC transporter substrate-binding protein [Acidocella sp.]